MKVVSVINYKGGVGKTTLTANLGAYAASVGKRVLMIDLDPQSNLTFNFIAPSDWAERYSGKMTLKNCFDPVTKDNANEIMPLSEVIISARADDKTLDIISSHLDLIETDMELAAIATVAPNIQGLARNALRVYSYLRNGLYELRNNYDLVMIDCPPNFYTLVKNAIVASDYYIVPAKLDYLSTLGTENLQVGLEKFLNEYDEYRKICKEKPYQPVFISELGVVPIMVEYSKGDTLLKTMAAFEDELRKKHYIFTRVRNNASVFGSAPKIGLPVVLTTPRFLFSSTHKKIKAELQQLGQEFINKLEI